MERMHTFESDVGSIPNSDTFQALNKRVCIRLAPEPSSAWHSHGSSSLAGYVMVPSPASWLAPRPTAEANQCAFPTPLQREFCMDFGSSIHP